MSARLVGVALAGAFIGLLALASSAGAQTAEADERAIAALTAEMTAAFNAHDAQRAAAMYAEDADMVTVRGERARGRAEIEQRLAAIFATRARNATLKTFDVQTRFVRADLAVVHVTNELSGLVAPDGAALPPHRELSVRVLVKAAGRWQVAVFHNTMIQPFGQGR